MAPDDARIKDVHAWLYKAELDLRAAAHELSAPEEAENRETPLGRAPGAQLERKVGQQTVEIDFLKGCLQRIEEQRMLQALAGRPRPTSTSKVKSRKASR